MRGGGGRSGDQITMTVDSPRGKGGGRKRKEVCAVRWGSFQPPKKKRRGEGSRSPGTGGAMGALTPSRKKGRKEGRGGRKVPNSSKLFPSKGVLGRGEKIKGREGGKKSSVKFFVVLERGG